MKQDNMTGPFPPPFEYSLALATLRRGFPLFWKIGQMLDAPLKMEIDKCYFVVP